MCCNGELRRTSLSKVDASNIACAVRTLSKEWIVLNQAVASTLSLAFNIHLLFKSGEWISNDLSSKIIIVVQF